jgi:hypothetical protein
VVAEGKDLTMVDDPDDKAWDISRVEIKPVQLKWLLTRQEQDTKVNQ